MRGMRFSFAPLLALVVFAVSAGIVWLAHIEAGEMTVDRQPPLVKASTLPLKRAPDDPGGRAVADLGGVGDLLEDQPAETEERLLPRPEQPVSPVERGVAERTDQATGEQLQARAALEALVSEIRNDRVGAGGPNPDDSVAFPSPSKPDAPAAPSELVTPQSVTPTNDAPQSVTADQQEPNELAALAPSFEAASNGRFRVQLAAVRAEEDAKRAWSVLQEQFSSYIGGLQPFFERAETSNGIFYRLQVGPFAESAEADRLCIELKKQDASCFVVSR